jgi:hypothetical protein
MLATWTPYSGFQIKVDIRSSHRFGKWILPFGCPLPGATDADLFETICRFWPSALFSNNFDAISRVTISAAPSTVLLFVTPALLAKAATHFRGVRDHFSSTSTVLLFVDQRYASWRSILRNCVCVNISAVPTVLLFVDPAACEANMPRTFACA